MLGCENVEPFDVSECKSINSEKIHNSGSLDHRACRASISGYIVSSKNKKRLGAIFSCHGWSGPRAAARL